MCALPWVVDLKTVAVVLSLLRLFACYDCPCLSYHLPVPCV
ncbi:hypothetical protein Pcac1_g7287 [Phytophthora cactorum]|uniref:Uncharacterized protein n=1 Tax=Phytophthora cactorum TaxID=29920 RepID=A0A8T0YYP7_9STRA|nr:hypothetical protein Pcac1_g7287 [Phytophthora cactorum]KAG2813731.1 hypothetical protein PC112_g14621 [Phytophthora cactorum]KAG2821244.1 hypothetical protein PC111_g11112 [Phytophthora cactorum]KAG2854865.1 hypothetical protein PC113_g12935 [Phytophthora cactorum]KAG2895002.1 hypothetical protein PC114_g15665 [Phytophthora cactorum]